MATPGRPEQPIQARKPLNCPEGLEFQDRPPALPQGVTGRQSSTGLKPTVPRNGPERISTRFIRDAWCPEPKVAVWGPFHDRLGARQADFRVETLDEREVALAGEAASQVGHSQS